MQGNDPPRLRILEQGELVDSGITAADGNGNGIITWVNVNIQKRFIATRQRGINAISSNERRGRNRDKHLHDM